MILRTGRDVDGDSVGETTGICTSSQGEASFLRFALGVKVGVFKGNKRTCGSIILASTCDRLLIAGTSIVAAVTDLLVPIKFTKVHRGWGRRRRGIAGRDGGMKFGYFSLSFSSKSLLLPVTLSCKYSKLMSSNSRMMESESSPWSRMLCSTELQHIKTSLMEESSLGSKVISMLMKLDLADDRSTRCCRVSLESESNRKSKCNRILLGTFLDPQNSTPAYYRPSQRKKGTTKNAKRQKCVCSVLTSVCARRGKWKMGFASKPAVKTELQ